MKALAKSILGFNLISLLGLIRSGPRQFVHVCSNAFSAAHQSGRAPIDLIPTISVGEILGDRRPVVKLPVMRYEDGMLPSEQAMVLLALLIAEQPREVLEIGTFMGHTTRLMAENLETATIHTVDLPPDLTVKDERGDILKQDDQHLIGAREVGREFKNQPCAARIRQHFGDSAKWDFAQAGRPTFFFIDGAHTYDYVKNDSEKALAVCAGPGVFLWHDCDANHPGIVRFILEWRAVGRDVRRIDGTPIGYWKKS